MKDQVSQVNERSTANVNEDACKEFRILYLFSGPPRKTDGFEKFCGDLGMHCTCMDIEYNPEHDLLDQDFWESLEPDLENYDGFLLSPPCSTFTPARSSGGRGPKPLRGTQGRDRYGLKGLTVEDKNKVKEGTLLSLRANKTARHAHYASKPWILEQPHWREEATSMFMLDEFQELMEQDGVYVHTFDQCRYQVEFEKKTDLLTNIEEMPDFEVKCNHPKRTWVIPWSGKKSFSSHPPLRGRQLGIPIEQWSEDMMRWREPDGDFLTRRTAAYSAAMNKQLAITLKRACMSATAKMGSSVKSLDGSLVKQVNPMDTSVKFAEPLHGQKPPEITDERNGLRNVHKWITPRMKYIGKQVMNLIERHLDQHPELQEELLTSLGNAQPKEEKLTSLDNLRCQVRDLLIRNRKEDMADHCNIEEVNEDDYKTVVRGHLLRYWALCVDDPAHKASAWLIDGAPAGLEADTSALDDVCPRVDDESTLDADALTTDYDNFENYVGVEDNQDALQALQSYASKGYLRKFQTLVGLRAHLGGEPILSKLGCILKTKTNPVTGISTKKSRIILDCRRSSVSKVAHRTHKSVLPRVSDAIQSTLALMGDCRGDETVTFLIADIVDAFWLIPLKKCERRFFTARLKGVYYSFERTAQGSRSAPLTFAAIIALASRRIQSILSTARHGGMHTEEARLQTYVDDPIFSIRGDEERRTRVAAIVLVAWSLMGFPVAFHKATLSNNVVWIGIELTIQEDGIEAKVPEAKVRELQSMMNEALMANVLSKKTLRTMIGKAMSIASVLFCWRPFIQELYVALHVEESMAPPGCVWVKQIRHTLIWLLTFLSGEMAGILRRYNLRNFVGNSSRVIITWDASPFGMGATLQINGRFSEYFAIQISEEDTQFLQTPSGTHEGQQVWEALAGLISLRLWKDHWQGKRAKLHIRADNIGSLTVLTTLKGGSKQLTLIAREYALDLGQAEWKPDVATHIPGISNVTCDALSRLQDPNKSMKIPSCLMNAKRMTPPTRDLTWWKTLSFERSLSAPVAPHAQVVGAGSSKRKRIND